MVGAVAMLAMFLGASIPMMEKRSLERRPAYQQVMDRVSLFVPRPPRTPACPHAPHAGSMTRPRVVIAGLGDTGVLTAVRLAKRYDVVGISAKPALVSGQELGLRLTRPQSWARNYHLGFDSLPGLEGVRLVHGVLDGLDLQARTVDRPPPGRRDERGVVRRPGDLDGSEQRLLAPTASRDRRPSSR